MADNRKEQERAELHPAIWEIAKDLRGSVDGWDFKQYVLGMLFYRYISENLTNYINRNEWEAGDAGFDYARLSDEQVAYEREDLVHTKGYLILPSQLFENVLKRLSRDENLSEDNLRGLFDDIDVNSSKLGPTVAKRNEKLVKLMNGIAELNPGDYRDHTINALGDAHEYLMGMHAGNFVLLSNDAASNENAG